VTKPLFGVVKQPPGFAALLFLAALAPAALIVTAMLGDTFFGSSWLGSDPIKRGEHVLGEWTLRLLFGTLLITPLRYHTGWNWLAKHRRTLGLFAFAYVLLHFLTWLLLDAQVWVSEYVGWPDVWKDITKRPFITIGFTAMLLLVPLALTSTKKSIARMGKRWKPLHQLIYPVSLMGVLHYILAVKKDITEPLLYLGVLSALLLWRVWDARRRAAAAAPAPIAA
jgi:methionine sulfoxide reductase heme-binding subunit